MKNFNWSLFLSSCVIGIAIVIAGRIISINLPDTTIVPNNLYVTTDSGVSESDEYMSVYEASAFLMMNTDDFIAFINSGELDKTFTVIQGNYVFSKKNLTQWIDGRIDSQLNLLSKSRNEYSR